MRRHLLGIASACLLLAALVLWLRGGEGPNYTMSLGACVRMGSVTFMMWLAWPDLRRIPKQLYWLVFAALALVAWRPKLMLYLIPFLGIMAVLRPRGRRKE